MGKDPLNGVPPHARHRRRRFIRRAAMAALLAAVLAVAVFTVYRQIDSSIAGYSTHLTPSALPADGVSSALLEVRLKSRFGNELNASVLPSAPKLQVVEGKGMVTVVPMPDSLSFRIVSGFQRGRVVFHIHVPGLPAPMEEELLLTPSLADNNANGYPDALDLTSESDRDAFRGWFVAIALGQLTHLDGGWTDRDCAGLLRYCYREAMKVHDDRWLATRRWLVSAALPDVRKYNYPFVPLVETHVFNAGFRTSDSGVAVAGLRQASAHESTSRPADLSTFRDFADAARLKDNSLAFVTRDPDAALPGDVLYFLNDTRSAWPYHSMIYVGNGATVYHTGPDGDSPGVVKKMSLRQLAAHPDPRWHPIAENPYFLGFYRWRILM